MTQHAFVKVPIRNPHPRRSATAPSPPNRSIYGDVTKIMSQKLLICIVDDNRCFREALEALVDSLDYDVATFASAEGYLNSDLIVSTSCLISDWQMPGMNGADLQDRLIGSGHRIPIVFVTAVCPEKERARLIKAGAIGVLEKLFDVNALIECLDNVFARDSERGPGN
jgi:FixJ family two-component response regulator